jgi:hypothetical protein
MPSAKEVGEVMGGLFMMLLYMLWAFGGFAGAIVAAYNGWLIGVVLSIFIPFFGGGYAIYELVKWLF